MKSLKKISRGFAALCVILVQTTTAARVTISIRTTDAIYLLKPQ